MRSLIKMTAAPVGAAVFLGFVDFDTEGGEGHFALFVFAAFQIEAAGADVEGDGGVVIVFKEEVVVFSILARVAGRACGQGGKRGCDGEVGKDLVKEGVRELARVARADIVGDAAAVCVFGGGALACIEVTRVGGKGGGGGAGVQALAIVNDVPLPQMWTPVPTPISAG